MVLALEAYYGRLCEKLKISLKLYFLGVALILFFNITFVVFFLVRVAFVTLLERKILRLVGLRFGPNKTSFLGILQPLIDALKLSGKQINVLRNSSFFFYYVSCSFILLVSLLLWECISPITLLSSKHSFLGVIALLSFNSLGSIVAGWSVFRKFSILGSMRTVVLLISYESVLFFCFLFFILYSLQFRLCSFIWVRDIFFFYSPFLLIIWVFSILADLNRTPFDFSERERELVRGFNTEFGSGGFTLLFLREYSNILFFSVITRFLFTSVSWFLGGILVITLILWIRSVLPRIRFDKIMKMAWKLYIPLVTLIFLLECVEFL